MSVLVIKEYKHPACLHCSRPAEYSVFKRDEDRPDRERKPLHCCRAWASALADHFINSTPLPFETVRPNKDRTILGLEKRERGVQATDSTGDNS